MSEEKAVEIIKECFKSCGVECDENIIKAIVADKDRAKTIYECIK